MNSTQIYFPFLNNSSVRNRHFNSGNVKGKNDIKIGLTNGDISPPQRVQIEVRCTTFGRQRQ